MFETFDLRGSLPIFYRASHDTYLLHIHERGDLEERGQAAFSSLSGPTPFPDFNQERKPIISRIGGWKVGKLGSIPRLSHPPLDGPSTRQPIRDVQKCGESLPERGVSIYQAKDRPANDRI